MKHTTLLPLGALAAALTGLWGCGDSGIPTTPGAWRSGPMAAGSTRSGSASAGSPLSAAVVTALNDTFQDELEAETTYLGVLGDFGDVQPFTNVVNAEVRHSESIARVFQNHGLGVPASRWTLDNVPHFGSLDEACAAAATAEQENVALYDRYLALDLPFDAKRVFENNRAASLERHLPAFQTCSCPACPAR